MAGWIEDQIEEIEENEDVDGEETDANPGDVSVDLEQFPGKKRCGDREREEFAPGFLKVEADAFNQGDGRVGKGEEADAAQEGIVDEGGFFEDEVDEPRLGIKAQIASKEVDFVGEVLVEQAMGADADGDEEQGVEKFIPCDEQQEAIVALAAGAI